MHGESLKSRFRIVALGGTFDYIHLGHRALLSKAFDSSDCVLIGVTTDNFVSSLGKNVDHNYKDRVKQLVKYLDDNYEKKNFQIVPLEDYFGPELYSDDVEAVVVSPETYVRIIEFSKKRTEVGLKPLQHLIVETVLAKDGKRISASRIRKGEIDCEGNLLYNK